MATRDSDGRQGAPSTARRIGAVVLALLVVLPGSAVITADDARADTGPADQTPSMIAAGGTHSCAVLLGGTVKCWGNNDLGQLGDGTTTNRTTPAPVLGITNAISIALGWGHSCAVLSDGTTTCWGNNDNGQLGDGTTTNRLTPALVSGVTNSITITSGYYHVCAVLSDGAIKCWGKNALGQLGDGSTTNRPTPVFVSGITTAISTTAGHSHSCAILSDGLTTCWGSNGSGQLGDTTTTQRNTPVLVSSITNARSITAGRLHTCAVFEDGTAKCWGSNSDGQLGDGSTTSRVTPVSVSGITNAVIIAGGESHSCAVLSDGAARCWGTNDEGQLGDGSTTQFIDGTPTYRTTPVLVSGIMNAIGISAGWRHICALLSDGTAKCWGLNDNGQLGDGGTANRLMPVLVSGVENVASITAGGHHSCAAVLSGTAKCWGYNANGQLGDGTTMQRVTSIEVPGITNAISISAGYLHTCALLSDGTVKCWGWNVAGQLGDGTTTSRKTPVAVSGISNAVSISAAYTHTCALLSDGTAKCWGDNDFGQLGDGTTTNRPTPVFVSGISQAVSTIAGGAHSCAILSDGTVQCWGYNNYGEVGDGTTTNRPTPVLVSGITNAVRIAGGLEHTCAVLSDGAAKCWGNNANGQIGDASTTSRVTPVSVSGITNAINITAGDSHSCAVLADGSTKCWGRNLKGQLGDGTTTDRQTLVSVSGLTNAISSSAGEEHSCAILSDGTANCWGYNVNGQLGDGTAGSSTTPVAVKGFVSAVPASPTGSPPVSTLCGDDFTSDPRSNNRWSLIAGNGSAWDGSNHFQFLTPVARDVASGMVANCDLTTRHWRASYDFFTGGGTGADGITLFFYKNGNPGVFDDALQGGHLFFHRGDGYAVEVDEWTTNPNDPACAHVALISGSTENHLANACFDPMTGTWHHAIVEYDGGRVTVNIDGLQLIDATIPVPDYTWNSIGFTAATGADTNAHAIDNFWVEDLTVQSPNAGAATAIAVGYFGSCALVSDGSARCWGDNSEGALGDGTATNRLTPVQVSGLADAVAIARGWYHACAIIGDGTVRCWGANWAGQLGDGSTVSHRLTPVQVSGLSNAVAINAGERHTCALIGDGTVRCWGDNANGKLGDGTTTNRLTPVQVPGLTNAIAITAGSSHTCALLADNTAWCWGMNERGNLGDGTTTDRLNPVQVSGLTNAIAITAGHLHSCALLNDGTTSCWGWNDYGQLGDGTTTNRLTPIQVPNIGTAVAIAGGYRYTCALLADGDVMCWGANWYGKLGDGTNTNRETPVQVSGLTNAIAIDAEYHHACALINNGTVRCWGSNEYGELGDGTTTSRATPVQVHGFVPATSIATTSNPTGTNVAPSTLVSDTATVSGDGPTPTGTVAFFLCQPAEVTAGGCEGLAGSQIGGPIALSAGTATSAPTTNTNTIGKYCWRAEYSGDANYAAATHTNPNSECFTTSVPREFTIRGDPISNPAPALTLDTYGYTMEAAMMGSPHRETDGPLTFTIDMGQFANKGSVTATEQYYWMLIGYEVTGKFFVDSDGVFDAYGNTATAPGDEPCRQGPFDVFTLSVNGHVVTTVQGENERFCDYDRDRMFDIVPPVAGKPENYFRIPAHYVINGLNTIEIELADTGYTHPEASKVADGWAMTVTYAQLELIAPPLFIVHGWELDFDPITGPTVWQPTLASNIQAELEHTLGQDPWDWASARDPDMPAGTHAFVYDRKADLRISAKHLEVEISRETTAMGYTGPVWLHGHSLGGLVARYYAESMGGAVRVAKLSQDATPNLGTPAADVYTRACRQFGSECGFIDRGIGQLARDGNWRDYVTYSGATVGIGKPLCWQSATHDCFVTWGPWWGTAGVVAAPGTPGAGRSHMADFELKTFEQNPILFAMNEQFPAVGLEYFTVRGDCFWVALVCAATTVLSVGAGDEAVPLKSASFRDCIEYRTIAEEHEEIPKRRETADYLAHYFAGLDIDDGTHSDEVAMYYPQCTAHGRPTLSPPQPSSAAFSPPRSSESLGPIPLKAHHSSAPHSAPLGATAPAPAAPSEMSWEDASLIVTVGTIAATLGATDVVEFPFQLETTAAAQFDVMTSGLPGNSTVTLVTPSGQEYGPSVNETTLRGFEGTATNSTARSFLADAPEPGNWTLRVIGGADTIQVAASARVLSTIDIRIGTDQVRYLAGSTGSILARALDAGQPIVGAEIHATVATSDGYSNLTLLDDGAHNDGAAVDGIYGASFSVGSSESAPTFTVNIGGMSTLGAFQREGVGGFTVAAFGDLAIATVSGTPSEAWPGDNVTISAVVTAAGERAIGLANVTFYDGDPLFGAPVLGVVSVEPALSPGESRVVSINSTAPMHALHVTAVIQYDDVDLDTGNDRRSADMPFNSAPPSAAPIFAANLTLVAPGNRTDFTTFGIANDSTNGYDVGLDSVAPPAPADPLVAQVYFSYPGNPNETGRLHRSYVPINDTITWPASLDVSGPAGNVTLSWDPAEMAPLDANFTAQLIDGLNVIDMRSQSSYSYEKTQDGLERRNVTVRLIAGPDLTISADALVATPIVRLNTSVFVSAQVTNNGTRAATQVQASLFIDDVLVAVNSSVADNIAPGGLVTFAFPPQSQQLVGTHVARVSVSTVEEEVTLVNNAASKPFEVVRYVVGLQPFSSLDQNATLGGSASYAFTVTNLGTTADNFTLDMSAVPPSWDVTWGLAQTYSLGAGESVNGTIALNAPASLDGLTDTVATISLTAVSTGDPSSSETHTMRTTLVMNQSFDLRAGWNLVALSVVPPDNSTSALFGPNVDKSSLYTWNGIAYVHVDHLSVGSGYWVLALAPENDTFTGVPILTAPLSLVEGWNLIGGTALSVPAPAAFGPDVVTFDGSKYVYGNTIDPGRGYWAYLDTLDSAPTGLGMAFAPPRFSPSGSTSSGPQFTLPITVSVGGVSDFVIIGSTNGATAAYDVGLDSYQAPAPVGGAYAQLGVVQAGQRGALFHRAFQASDTTQTWALKASTTAADPLATLSWSPLDLANIDPTYRVDLVDGMHHVNMRVTSTYAYTNTPGLARELQVIVTPINQGPTCLVAIDGQCLVTSPVSIGSLFDFLP